MEEKIIARVGFSRVDITPTEPSPLRGYGNTAKRLHDSVLDPILATCLAFSDGEEVLLHFTLDLCSIDAKTAKEAKKAIFEKVGIPADSVYLSCTHTHSAPDTVSSLEVIARWKPLLYARLAEAAEKAIADLAPAAANHAEIRTDNLNFVRRYLLKDGVTYIGDNSAKRPTPENPVMCHETRVDDLMQIVEFIREGKEPLYFVNWQSHVHKTGWRDGAPTKHITPDFVAPFRAFIEEKIGGKCAYFSGAAGNINPGSRIKSETPTADYKEYAEILASYFFRALENKKPLCLGKILKIQRNFSAPINHATDLLVPKAREISSVFSSGDRIAAKAKCDEYGISSPFAANAILTRSGLGEADEIPLWSYSFGDFTAALAPYEMFDTTGIEIRQASPFARTFICEQTNAGHGYFPTRLAFSHGGYEVDTCRYPKGIAEDLGEAFIDMQKTLFAKYNSTKE